MSLFVKIFSFFIPVLMILFGMLLWFAPPKDINNVYGYRTKRSMINDDAWNYAQVCMGKSWFLVGIVLVFVTLFLLPRINLDSDSLLITILSIQIVFMFLPLAGVEYLLKRKF